MHDITSYYIQKKYKLNNANNNSANKQKNSSNRCYNVVYIRFHFDDDDTQYILENRNYVSSCENWNCCVQKTYKIMICMAKKIQSLTKDVNQLSVEVANNSKISTKQVLKYLWIAWILKYLSSYSTVICKIFVGKGRPIRVCIILTVKKNK